ncbi:MAG TPA: glycosyltransferase [Thermoanaerobaculia bacterium]|jgi:glycosyltransferase involved in cell wall biosynthesis
MIVSRVVRDEGIPSALRRTRERIAERIEDALYFSWRDARIVNVAPGGTGARTGGVAVQLRARLRVERMQRKVFMCGVGGATQTHFEGGGVPTNGPYIVSVHDLTLLHAQAFLRSAASIAFASDFLRDQYQLDGEVIEPGLSVAPAASSATGRAIAFAGAVQRYKGGHLLPDIARALAARGETLHVFGRGDGDLLRALRAMKNVKVYGYYRAGTLVSILRRHGIGLVLVPSIVPESFCLTISEAWAGGAAVAAFDIGAQGERIRKYGGGWVAPLDSGAEGMIQIIDRWAPTAIPTAIPTSEAAARAYLDLYRRLGWLG